ncbi:MAG: efflux RND transporter periplasmic adaptor subunit [Simkaniaceae bacterium]
MTTPVPEEEKRKEEKARRKKKLLILLFFIVVFIAGGIWLFWWLMLGRFEESTSDAYVHGNIVEIMPQVSGYAAEIYVKETDYVKQGQSLVKLDTTDQELAFIKSKSDLAQTVRQVAGEFERTKALYARWNASKAEYIKTKQDYTHRKNLVQAHGVSLEDYQHAAANFKIAKENVRRLKHDFLQALAFVENTSINTHPLVLDAKQKMRQAYVNLKRCDIKSPSDGIVAQRKVQVGESVNPENPLMTVIPLEQIWIDANFKETDLKNIRIGQQVIAEADMYGSNIKFTGKVAGINPGTGSIFSVLPPQNATGNWIKIVQRLPVRVQLDPKQVKDHPLWLGLTMKVAVKTKDRRGRVVSESASLKKPLFHTQIFSEQLEGIDVIIASIVQKNLPKDVSPDAPFSLK